ncbi:MAG TPA: GAP family protein [Candidatus Angelobacter sp.]|nr:GAP family protein [Candidatus Angelobacter sp.]
MVEMWSILAPLIIVSAILPLQIIVILLLARSSVRAAVAWVAGMTAMRLIQGVLLGFVFSGPEAQSEASSSGFVGGLLLAVSLLMYAAALKKLLANEDEDAPPPKWTAKVASMSPLAAFAAGAGYIAINAKLWIFTLTAIDAIEGVHLGVKSSIVVYLVFVALAQSVSLTILLLAISSSSRSAAVLDGLSGWLARNARTVSVVLSLVFGTWFLFKALNRLGVFV